MKEALTCGRSSITRADDAPAPCRAVGATAQAPTDAPTQFLAGGTTLLDLMKLDVMRPAALVDINALHDAASARSRSAPTGLRLGALVRMAEAADHPRRARATIPVIAQALQLAASAQIRNMATLGGNVLQRTRCTYFRDIVLRALQQAQSRLGLRRARRRQPQARRARRQRALHRHLSRRFRAGADRARRRGRDRRAARRAHDPVRRAASRARRHAACRDDAGAGRADHRRSTCRPAPWTRRSLYLKIRDRESYEFALASAAVALDLDGGMVREARIALGGVATVPWRATRRRPRSTGKTLDERRAASRGRGRVRRAPSRASTTPSSSSSASARWSARCCRPPRWRSDMSRAAPEPKANMGQPAPRIDARLKVTGEARYASDMPVANPAYAFLVTSAIAKGAITSIDLDAAPAPCRACSTSSRTRTPASSKHAQVRRRAAAARRTSIQELGPRSSTTARSSRWWSPTRFEAAREAAYKVQGRLRRRDAERHASTSPARRRRRASAKKRKDCRKPATPRPRSPQRQVKIDADYAHADPAPQSDRAVHHHLRLERRRADHLRAEPVHVRAQEQRRASSSASSRTRSTSVSHFVGGAFGSKAQLTPRTALVALAAKRLNRPVKLVATRDQGFTIATYRAETRHHIRLGAQRDGKLVELQPRRLGGDVAARRLHRSPASRTRARLYAFGAVKTKRQRRARRPQHAGLHALAAGDALHVRAGKRDGRAGRASSTWTRSSCAASTTRMTDRDRQAVLEPLADEMLRRGGRGVRLGEARRRSPARCATATG